MANNRLPVLGTMLTALVLLSAGCAHNSTPSVPPSVLPAQRPPLPVEARQPKPPSICLPTCLAGVERLFENLGSSLMLPTPLASPANAMPMRLIDESSNSKN